MPCCRSDAAVWVTVALKTTKTKILRLTNKHPGNDRSKWFAIFIDDSELRHSLWLTLSK